MVAFRKYLGDDMQQKLHMDHHPGTNHLDVARRLGKRLVVVKGWGFGHESQHRHPDLVRMLNDHDLIVVDPLPLDWLFTRLGAVFIHGGMGRRAER